VIFFNDRQTVRHLALITLMIAGLGGASVAQAETPAPAPAATTVTPAPVPPAPKAVPAPATPGTTSPSAATPPTPATPPPVPPAPKPSDKAPLGADVAPPDKTQIEPNAAPGIPDNATTENVTVPARPIAMIAGQSSYDDAFKSIKTSIDTVTAAVAKAGLTVSGHPVTIFSEPDENGFKYIAGIPLDKKPEKTDLGTGVTIGDSPAGKAIKFQHRGAYDDIDSTYDVITAYLDAKGLQVGNPYIEEYLTDLKTADDPNLQVDIYVFVK
jgi:effector-binding domain-containing protein